MLRADYPNRKNSEKKQSVSQIIDRVTTINSDYHSSKSEFCLTHVLGGRFGIHQVGIDSGLVWGRFGIGYKAFAVLARVFTTGGLTRTFAKCFCEGPLLFLDGVRGRGTHTHFAPLGAWHRSVSYETGGWVGMSGTQGADRARVLDPTLPYPTLPHLYNI